jgi:hypothetical protein
LDHTTSQKIIATSTEFEEKSGDMNRHQIAITKLYPLHKAMHLVFAYAFQFRQLTGLCFVGLKSALQPFSLGPSKQFKTLILNFSNPTNFLVTSHHASSQLLQLGF